MDRELDQQVVAKRRRGRVFTVAGVVAASAIVLLLLPGWLRPSLPRARIRTARVERGTVQAVIEASGTVVPAFEKVISSPVEARVEKILKRPGEAVQPGDEILSLDTSATRLEIDRLEQRLAQKNNEREQLGLSLNETSDDLSSRAGSRRLDLEMLQYRVQQNRDLRAAGLVSEEALRESEVAAKKAGIELAQLTGAVGSAQRMTEAKLAGVALDIRILGKELDEARRQLELATTRADRAGVLTWTVLREGETVRKGDVIARIADLKSFRVEATVSDVHSSQLAAGLPVSVIVDRAPLPGRISGLRPAIENGVIGFTVDLDEASHPSLRNNLRVDVLVATQTHTGARRLAKGAFAQEGSVQQVFVVHDGKAVRTTARIGLIGRDDFEILEGLAEGDEVIVSDMRDYMYLEAVTLR